MSQKHNKRIENKKKKAAAFLELVKPDPELGTSKVEADSKVIPSSSNKTDNKTYGSSGQTKSLSDEMYEEYKKIMREKQKASMQRPKVFLTLDELARDDPIQTDPDTVKVPPPLFMADVQHLLLYALQGNLASIKPRWCRLLRQNKVNKVVAVVLDSLSSEEFKLYPESLPTLSQAFDLNAQLVSPVEYGSSAREDIMNVPISISQMKKQLAQDNKSGSHPINKAIKHVKQVQTILNPQKWCLKSDVGTKRKRDDDTSDTSRVKKSRYDFPDEIQTKDIVSTYELDQFDRRWLMLNSAQMIWEGLPAPTNDNDARYHGYMFSKRSYKEVTSHSPLFAVDCEMVQTKASKMDLARVSLVDENLQVVMDMFVKPWAPVTNYVTQFSGITQEILDPVTTRLSDVQRIIQTYLPPDAILCGQSIASDLSAMKLFHPYVIDTSVIFNLTGDRRFKTGLKRLTSIFLRRGIQESELGHSSVEDAKATMELVLLKLRNSMEFGDMMMSPASVLETVNKTPCHDDTTDNSKDPSVNTQSSKSPTNSEDTNSKSSSKDSNSNSKTSNNSGQLVCSNSSATVTSQNSDNNNTNSCLTRTLVTLENHTIDVQRRKIFFQREGGRFIENFLMKIEKQKKSGVIIDNADSVPLYPSTLPVIVSDSDKNTEKQTIKAINEGSFCFTHLYGYKNYLSEKSGDDVKDAEKAKKVLWKLDRRFWKIMMGLPASSLFVVVLPGRDNGTGSIHPAMTFAKIT